MFFILICLCVFFVLSFLTRNYLSSLKKDASHPASPLVPPAQAAGNSPLRTTDKPNRDLQRRPRPSPNNWRDDVPLIRNADVRAEMRATSV